MNFLTTLLVAIYCLFLQVEAAPLNKRLFAPSSPVFSLIAIHKGEPFHAHLVKFNGSSIKLGSDDKALFGTIEADNGYILNLPTTNGSNITSVSNVVVSNKTQLLETTTKNGSASQHFGITNGWLSFLNSTSFLACAELDTSNVTASRNSTGYSNITGNYDLYFNPKNTTKCPSGVSYDVKLSVQLSVPISFSPETNAGGFFKRGNLVNKFFR
ncbi:hypothetical protein KGF56_003100 [Candida oxycetoniae]|uniref:Hyphally-regulated cell wall protein N-terminal domain-containing protein n=1 Tax=Candida oxycetoniae TaxID=497107 RepID=A0AAI9WXJ4_9ASCO|nr:uncharacterized protein KGF56_003100 [Candida oxycetoniae]KAI3404064.2 hypothetical protein KGF56_003100 [Candida oxycetoniae]